MLEGDSDIDEEELPPGCYSTDDMRALRSQTKGEPPEAIRTFANSLWEKLPDTDKADRPTSAWTREGLFSDKAPARPKERTITNQVLGILTRLTPENYTKMEEELLLLPIRQSTKEQIESVVNTIYMKAIRPEDAPYVELYMKLVVALVNHTGTNGTGVGKTICRAIVENCQQQFEGSKFILKPEDLVNPDGTPCDPEEIEYKKKMLKDKLKANITFLGHLYIHHLVQEKVVNLVLYQLMYGDQSRPPRGRHKPEDYEVEMFCELFKKVGPHLTTKTLQGDHWPTYIESMKTLSSTSNSMRIKFMLLDSLEIYANGWKSKKRDAGPLRLEEQRRREMEDKMRQTAEIEQAIRDKGRAPVRNVPATPAQILKAVPEPVRLPPKTEIISAMEDFVQDPSGDNIMIAVEFLRKLPAPEHRVTYMAHWVERTLTAVKCNEEREVLGDALDRLVGQRVLSSEEATNIVDQRLKDFAEKGLYEDNPKLFSNWARVVVKDKSGRLGVDMHSRFLAHLVAAQRPVEEIEKFISTLFEDSGSKLFSYGPNGNDSRRFRILPHLLRYEPAEGDEEIDILDALNEVEGAVEVHAFNHICKGSIKDLTSMIGNHAQRAELGLSMMAVCAIFTFCRFDTSRLDSFKEYFSSQVRHHNRNADFALGMLLEVYNTWKDLEQTPDRSFYQTVNWLLVNRFVASLAVENLKKHFKSEGPAGEEILKKWESKSYEK